MKSSRLFLLLLALPFGKALQFSYLWDGYNLLNALTREVVIETGGGE